MIRVARLAKSYGGNQVLRGIDLDIARGESVSLIGANGAGKSTLLKCLIGLLPATGGEITTLGARLGSDANKGSQIRSGIGFVFQHHGLVRRLSALSNVVQGWLGMRGGWRALHQALAPAQWRHEAMQALDMVGLASHSAARADQLSGGQSQRVAIARALVRRPQLFIADEPTASLDPAAGHDVMNLFVSIARRTGSTLVFTSHDMEHALSYADRIVALREGRIVIDAPAAALGSRDLEAVFRD